MNSTITWCGRTRWFGLVPMRRWFGSRGRIKRLAMTVDCNSRYCLLHPYEGARLAVAEAARNLVCSGAEPIGLTDCLNFGNPERPEIMWQFVLGDRRDEGCLRAFRRFPSSAAM